MNDANARGRYFTACPKINALARAVHGTQLTRETFLLPDRWALHFYEYRGRLEVGHHRFDLHPGAVTIVPPGARVTFHYEGPSPHLYCHFTLQPPGARRSVTPVFFDADHRLPPLRRKMEEVVGTRLTDPLRANVRLWDVLLGLAAILRQPAASATHATLMENATALAEQELTTGINVSELARRCSISANQFTRIVRGQTGLTPRAWLTRMRLDRAGELLAYSDLPIKVVACEVGVPDLQHFNKLVRARFGHCPRRLREHHRHMSR